MKRRAIKLANNTLVVSLPSKWVQQNHIEKGDDLEVSVKDTLLIITRDAASGAEQKKAKLDISGMNTTLVWNYIDAMYRSGFNEIEIFFQDQMLQDIKTGKKSRTMDVISRVADKLIGMEIIRQSKSSCVLKEITQLKGDEFHQVLNRIFLSLLTISEDILSAAKVKDKETLENIHLYSEVNLNKLSDYCMRILNTEGLGDFKESNSYHLITFLLEEVGDAYADIARSLSQEGARLLPETVSLFESTNALLHLAHKFQLNPQREYYISFHEERNALKRKMAAASSGKNVNQDILFLFKTIIDKLMEANNSKLTALDGFRNSSR